MGNPLLRNHFGRSVGYTLGLFSCIHFSENIKHFICDFHKFGIVGIAMFMSCGFQEIRSHISEIRKRNPRNPKTVSRNPKRVFVHASTENAGPQPKRTRLSRFVLASRLSIFKQFHKKLILDVPKSPKSANCGIPVFPKIQKYETKMLSIFKNLEIDFNDL